MSVKTKEIFLLIGLIFFSINVSAQINFKSSLSCNGAKFAKTEEQQNASISLSSVIKEQHIDIGGRCLGWTNLEQGSVWYVVAKEVGIFAVDVNINKYLGTWSIGSFNGYLFLSGESMAAQEVIAASEGGSDEFIKPKNPLEQVKIEHPIFMPSVEEELKQRVGCFENTPLRYGDLESDGTNELVLFLSKDFIIFSPALRKITFAAHYFLNDEITPEEEESFNIKHDGENDPALLAGSMIFSDRIGKGGLFAAQRSISKIYFGHFIAADSNDIILWRKLYQSRLNKDPIKGFEKLGDVYVHYKLINGEYQKQATPEETIKSWLAAKQLTWQKGYPSKSECPGQEGQLIPEMHDPLLNDPDVLQ